MRQIVRYNYIDGKRHELNLSTGSGFFLKFIERHLHTLKLTIDYLEKEALEFNARNLEKLDFLKHHYSILDGMYRNLLKRLHEEGSDAVVTEDYLLNLAEMTADFHLREKQNGSGINQG